jgi:hypothetical protein
VNGTIDVFRQAVGYLSYHERSGIVGHHCTARPLFFRRSPILCLRVLAVIIAAFAAVVQAQSPAARIPVPGAPPGVTAFVDVNVVPMDTERVLTNQTVLVQQDQITALGPSDKVKVPPGAALIDGRGKYLMPGLADMHAHLGFSEAPALFDSVAIENRLFLWLANGLTTVRNLDHTHASPASAPYAYFDQLVRGEELLRWRTRAASGELWSPRIYTSGPLRGADGGPLLLKDVVPAVRAYKAAGYDFIKLHYVYRHGDVFDSLVTVARQAGLPLVGHVEDVTTTERALAEYRSVEHLGGPGSGFVLTDPSRRDALAAAMQRAGVWNCPTQFNEILNTATAARSKEALGRLSLRGQFIKALQDAGAGLLVGSDRLQSKAPTIPPTTFVRVFSPKAKLTFDGLFEAVYGYPSATHRELEALVDVGLSPYQALVAGTRNVAIYFGTLKESGTIAVGKRADAVLLSGNPLQDIRHTARPAGVMLGGRWLPREAIDARVAAIKASLRPRCDSLAAATGRPPCRE